METSKSRKLCQRSKWPCWHGCKKRAAPTQVFPRNLLDKSSEPIGNEISGGGSDFLVKERDRYDFGHILIERPRNYNNIWKCPCRYATTCNLLWLAIFFLLLFIGRILILSYPKCWDVQACATLRDTFKRYSIKKNVI